MRRPIFAIVLILAACSSPAPRPDVPHAPPPPPPETPDALVAPVPAAFAIDSIKPGESTHGFTAQAIYLDDADRPMGARFIHDRTHFTFDYLRIESAPQGFIWVNSFPTSDKGEPHTQEHLLLGKGDRGRKLGSMEAMALAESSAFTEQWHTCYHFHTVAGHDVFWPVFEDQLDALLYPDYTDEEIRREVRNFGVDKGTDGKLRLEEKGTVYNEMVRTYEQPEVPMSRVAGQLVYGTAHPLSFESGGFPEAIRTMTPSDIRTFHDNAYHLWNMGMVGAFPSSMQLADVLDRTSSLLDGESAKSPGGATTGVVAALPRPAPAAPGTIQITEFPSGDTTTPGPIALEWPATRNLDEVELTLLELFVETFAGDESTTLYKKLVDSKTRVLDIGTTELDTYVSDDQGNPVTLVLEGVKANKLDKDTIEKVRALVLAELAHLATLPAGDPELVAFDARVASRVVDRRRRRTKFLDTPPGFGFRGSDSGWMTLLLELSKESTTRRSLTMRPTLAKVSDIVAAGGNPWHDRLAAWGLLDAPFGVAARPSPKLRADIDAARGKRIDAELARLATQYGAKDTLVAYQRAYDAETATIEAATRRAVLPPLVSSLPMTFDDELKYTTDPIDGVRTLSATFDTMASARVELSMGLDRVPTDELFYLALLPSLLRDVGVVDHGATVTAAEVRERLRKEILSLDVYYRESPRSAQHELVIAGSGNDAGETRLAIGWIKKVMTESDWRPENLPRIRDVVEQAIVGLRATMEGAEEGWVTDPRDAWWRQRDAVHLHTASFLTKLHDLHRLRWMLEDPGDAKAREAAASWLDGLAGASSLSRAQLVALTGALADKAVAAKAPASAKRWLAAADALPKAATSIAVDAGKDLGATLSDAPDSSLAADWTYLCKQMAHDLRAGSGAALAGLDHVRSSIIAHGEVRVVLVGSTSHLAAIRGDVTELVSHMPDGGTHDGARPDVDTIAQRLADRGAATGMPKYVGLVDTATSSGVFLNTAPAPGYRATTDADVLDYLTSNLYTGHGAHSMFMKTWAAGLAYSNGLHPQPGADRIEYYAERCPLLPQTLKFVIDQLRAVSPDANIARYAIAGAFDSRIAQGYEARASRMASDLADGTTPDVVRHFRERVLALAKGGDLATSLFQRVPAVYGKVLPGFGSESAGAVSFVIGPDKQLTAYQDYLHAAVGKSAALVRLMPRDFWIVEKL